MNHQSYYQQTDYTISAGHIYIHLTYSRSEFALFRYWHNNVPPIGEIPRLFQNIRCACEPLSSAFRVTNRRFSRKNFKCHALMSCFASLPFSFFAVMLSDLTFLAGDQRSVGGPLLRRRSLDVFGMRENPEK